MIRIPKSVVSFGAVALVAGVLTLAVPRAAHAVAAALVQVTNTVTTQDTSRQASQLVHLNVELSSDQFEKFNLVTLTGPIANYSVPTTASLVITSVDITPAIDSAGISSTVHLFGGEPSVMLFAIPGQPNLAQFATVHYSYPAGIVIGPGLIPSVQMLANNGVSGNDVFVDLVGYLTNN
jgi:hypothetical protein